jgi:hypothetical protein
MELSVLLSKCGQSAVNSKVVTENTNLDVSGWRFSDRLAHEAAGWQAPCDRQQQAQSELRRCAVQQAAINTSQS